MNGSSEDEISRLRSALDAAEAERAHDEQRVADLMADVQRIGAERDAAKEAARTWANEAERRSQRYIGMVHERDAAIARAEAERARVIKEAVAACEALCKDYYPHARAGYDRCIKAIRALAAKGEQT